MNSDTLASPATADSPATGSDASSGAPVVIVGAGLAGLSAATRLSAAGRRVVVVEKSRRIGGRLATRRLSGHHLDYGAQFFTARSPEFAATVAQWVDAGLVTEWCRGFHIDDGYPRFRVVGGMNRLAAYLARELDPDRTRIVTRAPAEAVLGLGDRWALTYTAGTREADEAAAVIITAPVPLGLALLANGAVTLDPTVDRERLRAFHYHQVVAVLALVEGRPELGPAGARQAPDDPTFSFVSDNRAKGLDVAPGDDARRGITVHVSHALSQELFGADDAHVIERLRPAIAEVVAPARVVELHLSRWRHAGPVEPWPDQCLVVARQPGPLVLAGDAFGGAKIEGAFRSGLAAAEAVLAAAPERDA